MTSRVDCLGSPDRRGLPAHVRNGGAHEDGSRSGLPSRPIHLESARVKGRWSDPPAFSYAPSECVEGPQYDQWSISIASFSVTLATSLVHESTAAASSLTVPCPLHGRRRSLLRLSRPVSSVPLVMCLWSFSWRSHCRQCKKLVKASPRSKDRISTTLRRPPAMR